MKKFKYKIKTGDTVKVITGNNKNKVGRVLSIQTINQRATVSGLNMRKKHVKPGPKTPKGGIVLKEMSIHISNLVFVDSTNGNPSKIGRKLNEKNNLQRYSKVTGKFI